MPTQAIALIDHSKNPENVTSNLSTLVATGAGNGFEIPFTGILLIFIHNDTGSSADVTIKSQPTQDETDRGITPSDESQTVANGETFTWYPSSRFKDTNGKIVIEATQLIKAKAIKKITIS